MHEVEIFFVGHTPGSILERHDIPTTYITDVDIERAGAMPEGTTHLVTVGPMRYWTSLFDGLRRISAKTKARITFIWVPKRVSIWSALMWTPAKSNFTVQKGWNDWTIL